MKNANKIGQIGDILLVLGSALYVYELLTVDTAALTAVISVIYAAALVLKLIHRIGTRNERRAAKAASGKKEA